MQRTISPNDDGHVELDAVLEVHGVKAALHAVYVPTRLPLHADEGSIDRPQDLGFTTRKSALEKTTIYFERRAP